jgi:hypothetical protein
MAQYRKQAVVIEAVQWDGKSKTIFPLAPFENATEPPEVKEDGTLVITTLEGVMKADLGDYVIKGVRGEIYPIKESIFNQTYEVVVETVGKGED